MNDKVTPKDIYNRAALSTIYRRVGMHAEFKESMLRGLTSIHRPGLANFETRDDKDFTVAYIDAASVCCDILSFYIERVANEAYLRTAEDRRSLRLLARHIGYEMAPAKAASVCLAFIAEETNAPVEVLSYAAPLQVKSVPRDGQLPQTFETVETLYARADWNAIRPRLSFPQVLDAQTDSLLLTAEAPILSVGGIVVFMRGSIPVSVAVKGQSTFVKKITLLEQNQQGQWQLQMTAKPSPKIYSPVRYNYSAGWVMANAVLSTVNLGQFFALTNWSQSQIITASRMTGTPLNIFTEALLVKPWEQVELRVSPYHFSVQAPLFGHNAITRRAGQVIDKVKSVGEELASPDAVKNVADAGVVTVAIPGNVAQQNTALDAGSLSIVNGNHYIYLDRVYDDITVGTVVVLRGNGNEGYAKTISVEAVSIEGFGTSGRVTRLELPSNLKQPGDGTVYLSAFRVRGTVVIAAPEALSLAALPIDNPVGAGTGDSETDESTERTYIGADEIELDGPYLDLTPGRSVAVIGMNNELDGVESREVKTIAEVSLNDGHTILRFTSEFAHIYKRRSVILNANVALATHGESVQTIIGNGNARESFARFPLKGKPLTYVSASNEKGMSAVLDIRVNGVLWDEISSFRDAGPEDHIYVIRHSEDGTVNIVFGNGETGARLPTGQSNITAAYRIGAGAAGLLEADQLSLMSAKPSGIKSVSNPLAPAGAADGETLAQVRINAPTTTLTLGRVVSLMDYQNYAQAFAGMAKARADWVWDGTARPIIITVAGEGGVALPSNGPDINNLRSALRKAGDPDVPLQIFSYELVDFTLNADLFIEAAYESDKVIDAVNNVLSEVFSFDARQLGQPVNRSEVVALIQAVEGVKAVDLNSLHRLDQDVGNYLRLVAARPIVRLGVPDKGAELLVLSPVPPQLGVVS